MQHKHPVRGIILHVYMIQKLDAGMGVGRFFPGASKVDFLGGRPTGFF